MSTRRVAFAIVFVSTVSVFVGGTARPVGAGEPPYRPPVEAPIVDPFRPPASDYGPGNRGLTYDLTPGTPVRASAPGTVAFAGSVGGTVHVSVLHADGLRTTYSFLESVAVRRGQTVEQGEQLGTGGAGFHFGVRDGDAYLDPAALFAQVEVRVRLVPHTEPLPAADAGLRRERDVLVDVARDHGILGRIAGRAEDLAAEALGSAASTLGLAGDLLAVAEARLRLFADLDQARAQLGAVVALLESLREECTPAATVVPAAPAFGHVAVLVAGHGSDADAASIDEVDAAALGYGSGDVLRFSYRGGRTPRPGLAPDLAAIPVTGYDPADTLGDLRFQGRQLADLVESVAAIRPGAPIDLLAHSQGGIVTRLALEELERRGGLARLGTVVTLGSPHGGTELATGGAALSAAGAAGIQRLFDDLGVDLDADSVAMGQMAETSALIDRLDAEGVPGGVDFRTIAATGDLVVVADKSAVEGHAAARVSLHGPTAHAELPGAEATQRELRLALAGMAPGCRSVGDRVLDAAVPAGIGWAENTLLANLVR